MNIGRLGFVGQFSHSKLLVSRLSTTVVERAKPKFKCPKKRASSLLASLKVEEFEKLRNGRTYQDFRPGDTIAVHSLPFLTSPTTDILKGLVIGKVNRGCDSSLTMINVEFGSPVMRTIRYYSPLVKDIKVIQKAFIHDGKKRVRRSKLYYFWQKDPKFFTLMD